MNKAKSVEIASLTAFFLAVVISLVGLENDCNGIKNAVLRLHVIANSDSLQDQQLKLAVRDAVLEEGKEIFSKSESKQKAAGCLEKNKARLEEAAKKVIEENGKSYDVKIELGKSYFPTKTYENVTLPAGEYDAVRVLIGKAEGKNWWCVMFPPLCLPSEESEKIEDVLTKDELELARSNPKYDIRFWIVEKLSALAQKRKEKTKTTAEKSGRLFFFFF